MGKLLYPRRTLVCQGCGDSYVEKRRRPYRPERKFCSPGCCVKYSVIPNRVERALSRNAATEHPTVRDIAWAAGVYEGEGSVYARTPNTRTVEVGLPQKDRWLCERLRSLFGGRVSSIPATVTHNGINVWRLSGPRAVGFMLTIYTFLSPRRKEQFRSAYLGHSIG